MYPVLFRLGPLEIKSYGVMLALSFVVGFLLARKRAGRHGIDQAVLLDLCFIILVAAIVGSRGYYVLTHVEQYSNSPLGVFSIWEGGLSMMGGVLLSLLASYLYLKKKEISFTLMADILAPSIALGLAITRIGCFFYGCCYGLPTESALGVEFPGNSAAGSHYHVPIHPTQLYASAYGFLILLVLLWADRKSLPRGGLFGLLMVLYAPARFAVDFVRYYGPDQYLLNEPLKLTNNQVIVVFLFLLGVVLMLRRDRGDTRKGG